MGKPNTALKQNQNAVEYDFIEGSVAEKTSFIDNLNLLIRHINHVAVYSDEGSYSNGVQQLSRMLNSYKDQKFKDDILILQNKISSSIRNLSPEDKQEALNQMSYEIAGEMFSLLMNLMSRSGLSPTARIGGIDMGNTG